MPTRRTSDKPVATVIYQLKITLKDSKPPIWRRVQVASDTRLSHLHVIIQLAMGWGGGHLHQFFVGNTIYSEPNPEMDSFGYFETKNEQRAQLNRVASKEGSKFAYEYDFGDSWDHAILVEKILEPEPGVRYPRCVAGKRACPPEDCGGIWGYYGLLETLSNPDDPEYADIREWMGDADFDPAAFSLDESNARLKQLQ
jgi:hypothetical protein